MRRGNRILGCDWSEQEIAALRATYADKKTPVSLAALALKLGRNKANVCRKARSLGLTNQSRGKSLERKPPRLPKYETAEARNAAVGNATRLRIASEGHPRGALGIRHSAETKKVIGTKARAAWADKTSALNSEQNKQRLSDLMLKRHLKSEAPSGYSRCRGGKRADLGNIYFRSAWEANYARYLNFLVSKGQIAGWAFEPKTFEFPDIKRGTRAYTPDFRIDLNTGAHEWHEVKGWMDAKSKTRLARFAKRFPQERLLVIDSKWFKSANTTVGRILPGWERGTVHV